MDALEISCHFASADEPTLQDRTWVEQQWTLGRLQARREGQAVLILDEIQKVENWTSIVKQLWDRERWSRYIIDSLIETNLCRELGIPAVTGVEGIKAIQQGERLRIDGGLGRVYRLEAQTEKSRRENT